MRVNEALLKGKTFLQEHNWTKGMSYNDRKNAFCATGALYGGIYGIGFWKGTINPASDDTETARVAERYLDKAAIARGASSAIEYNDRRAHRKRDILTLYDRAIALANEVGE